MFDDLTVKCDEEAWPGYEAVEGHAYIYKRVETGKFIWIDETGDISNEYETVEEAAADLNAYCKWLEQEYYGIEN